MTEKTLIKNKDELVKKAKHPQRPQQSIAMEILHDFKVENTTLKVLSIYIRKILWICLSKMHVHG